MLAGIDHIAVAAENIGAVARDYAAVLGLAPNESAIFDRHARLQLDNMAIVITTWPPEKSGAANLKLVLATTDIEAAARRLSRRGIAGAFEQPDGILNLDIRATHGVPIGVMETRSEVAPNEARDIAGLDHVVIRTPDPERAVALYGGRLGLDLRLDRSNAEFGSRMLFFVCGGLVVEITHDLKQGVGTGPDRLWGLAWRARDIDRANARMLSHGVDVSAIRTGRRPGTRVFTVKSHTAGVPTLVIGGEGLERS
jgi:catechol 2,3-dioxygenase-like lactoylglutathione lyase family enzyme